MKNKLIIAGLLITFIVCGCERKIKKDENPNQSKQSKQNKEFSTKEKTIVKKETEFTLKEKREEYRTTDYDSRLLSTPNSQTVLTRIPPNTKLKILDKQTVQQGQLRNNWYKVKYNEKSGWVSGWNMKEGEELVVTSVGEMERNYEKQIGKKPQNNPLNGKIEIVIKWLNNNAYDYKSIKFNQWYEPYLLGNCWNCRVEFSAKNKFGVQINEDKIFKVKNDKIIEVVNKF